MSKYIPGNQKHLTLNDRIYIENELAKGTTFKDIAAFLCKDPTTISKEVRTHRLSDWYHKGTFYNAKNFCIHRYHCQKTNACGKILLCGIKCASCPTCNQTCKDFEKERCKRLDKAPYVCNGCTKKINHCTIAHKYYYNGRAADRKYRELLISSRSGINMTKHQLHQKDQIISPLIEQGQSPYQILTNHPELDMSVRSMYTYIDKGLFTARNIDLKRQAKFKPPPLYGRTGSVGPNRTYPLPCGRRPPTPCACRSCLVVQMADHIVARLDLTLLRHLGLALLHAVGAAGMELAASRRIRRGGNGALQHDTIHLHRGIRHRDGRKQGLGVGVQRVAEDVLRSAVLHQIAQIHDAHRVGDVFHHGQIVGDEEIRQVVLFL